MAQLGAAWLDAVTMAIVPVPHTLSRAERLRLLTRCNVDDLLTGFALPTWAERTLAVVARVPARRFAHVLVAYDDLVAHSGMVAGAEHLLTGFTRTVRVAGAHHIPASGPLLVVANHPGLVDAMALVRALGVRRDLRILAIDRDLLRALPAVSSHLMYVDPARGGRADLIRRTVAHLRAGGAVLTFPAGRIEPDPAIHRVDAVNALAEWGGSTGMFVRLAPGTRVLPVVVGGVISRRARDHRLARTRERRDRDWRAATLQILWPPYRDTATTLHIGEPIDVDQYTPAALTDAMSALIADAARGAAACPT